MASLYVVATPIGNLEDLTLRAARILRECSVWACEDTRVAAKLASHLEVRPTLLGVHAHSQDRAMMRCVEQVQQGTSIAYVCDAGTPGVNDPGGKLVEMAYEAGVQVVPIPGASALTTAISACGFPMERFWYRGFPPHKKGRETYFREVADCADAVVFFESTHRIMKALETLRGAIEPTRLVFVGRELTKMHESLYRGTIDEVVEALQASSTKGEFVIILAPQSYRNV